MTSNITKTKTEWKIDVTGEILAPGHRVAAGSGEDYDTGTIDEINGNKATVRWDSNVVTVLPLENARVLL